MSWPLLAYGTQFQITDAKHFVVYNNDFTSIIDTYFYEPFSTPNSKL
jgi:hypothetical protein